jgi:hypothetical protein
VPVRVPQKRGEATVVDRDEHVRADTTLAALAKLGTPFRRDGSVTAGNASGVNDGACALVIASEEGAAKHGLTPRARILTMATAGVPPRVMGMGPVPATLKALARLNLSLDAIDVIELNEAFASQSLAVLRTLGMPERGARESQWRRDRARPPARHERRAPRNDGDVPTDARERTIRALHDVHRRRPRHRDGDRTCLARSSSHSPQVTRGTSRTPIR